MYTRIHLPSPAFACLCLPSPALHSSPVPSASRLPQRGELAPRPGLLRPHKLQRRHAASNQAAFSEAPPSHSDSPRRISISATRRRWGGSRSGGGASCSRSIRTSREGAGKGFWSSRRTTRRFCEQRARRPGRPPPPPRPRVNCVSHSEEYLPTTTSTCIAAHVCPMFSA